MVLPSTVPVFDASLSTPGSAQRAPVAQLTKAGASCRALQVRCSWQRGRLMPTVRCVLVGPEYPISTITSLGRSLGSSMAGSTAGVPPGPKLWNSSGTWASRTRRIAVALADTHKAWSSQSFQTLQRVGSIIRSTSLDCLAALGKQQNSVRAAYASTAAGDFGADHQHQQPALRGGGSSSSSGGSGGRDPQQDDSEDSSREEEDRLVRASLGRFLTAAEGAEVMQAARMADLSDMAYNVLEVTPDRLQQALGFTLITHSRSSNAAGQQSQLLLPAAAGSVQQPHQQQEVQGEAQSSQLQQQLAALPEAPWPAPLVLLQRSASTGSSGGPLMMQPSNSAGDLSTLSASPRAPAVMRSYAEDDLSLFELQAVTASAACADPGSPLRRPSAAAAASAGGAAVMGMPAATAMGNGPPPDYGAGAAAGGSMLAQWDAQQQQYNPQQQQYMHLDEAALLQQLKQQEAFILLELQASQQMMVLLQQSSQQQQQLHLHEAAGDTAAAAHDLEQLQELAAATTSITAAASTAAAAALAGSGMLGAELAMPPSATAAAAALAVGAEGSAAGSVDADAAPADWFCCDGPLSSADPTATRFFSIQGSLTLEHWRINLTIDPCEFEGGALGPIRVHRGMYEAALSMYEAFLPLVQQHLAAHPGGKIALTGHSLGGSLATLLMLLMVHRGDLPVANVATVYTFGSPAVFCEGANGSPATPGACQCCSLPCEHRKQAQQAAASSSHGSSGGSATDSLLSKLGLAADAVVNVIMTRDIVPRAFVCDYTLVAGVLKSWLPSFKQHTGLAACKDHKALYNFIGVVEVLQPSSGCDFVLPGEGHDMLPPGAALYKLIEPRTPAPRSSSSSDGGSGSSTSRQSRRASTGGGGGFNSLSSLTNIASMSLSSALAELTSSFSLGGSARSSSAGGSARAGGNDGVGVVTVPVTEAEAHADAAAAAAALAAAAVGGDVSPFALAATDVADSSAPHPMSPAGAVAASSAAGAGAAASKLRSASSRSSSRPASSCSSSGGAKKSPEGLTLGDAILTFMNTPHPLQTLGEMRAYGHNGSISRYHNPASYTKALQQLSRE